MKIIYLQEHKVIGIRNRKQVNNVMKQFQKEEVMMLFKLKKRND